MADFKLKTLTYLHIHANIAERICNRGIVFDFDKDVALLEIASSSLLVLESNDENEDDEEDEVVVVKRLDAKI